ncbi:hypothetical protein P280DRAFT_494690 [Massarina eburnea CBS 473.64]|uniref:Mis12-Mtw1 family protein n=1 Tax=Massarina eburnea CBS 473.64 TaxID=1395130 RepID=A0A6A6SFC4_9PLEO|nr:hypothetical protein P280DRAFT_494690 [Massarina eburnea CBS 473.64]
MHTLHHPHQPAPMTSVLARSLPMAANRRKRAAYDEDDDGFQFTRRTSKRVKAPPPPPEPSQRRRSARLSGDHNNIRQVDGPADRDAPPKSLPRRTKKPAPKPTPKPTPAPAPPKKEKEKRRQKSPAPQPPAAQPEGKGALVAVKTPTHTDTVSKKRDGAATKIMLPFADTPVITRNKEMRKKDGNRRSSTGLRGRRASSLIDSGLSNALPHSEVDVRDFYKYIEDGLPEPRRMKQLLTWGGSRALPAKPSGDVKDANAIMAARAIQQELIDDFANEPELSNWFSREETAPPTVIKKPNPQNEKNQKTLLSLQEEIKRLEEEESAWKTLASSSNAPPPPPLPTVQTTLPSFSDIDTSLLDPSQAAILSSLQTSQTRTADPSISATDGPSDFTFRFASPAALQEHLDKLAQSLEPNIDLFADGLHKIEQYRNAAERVADRVLGTASKRLEERDKKGKEKVGSEGIGVGDVLRGLAGVLNEQ